MHCGDDNPDPAGSAPNSCAKAALGINAGSIAAALSEHPQNTRFNTPLTPRFRMSIMRTGLAAANRLSVENSHLPPLWLHLDSRKHRGNVVLPTRGQPLVQFPVALMAGARSSRLAKAIDAATPAHASCAALTSYMPRRAKRYWRHRWYHMAERPPETEPRAVIRALFASGSLRGTNQRYAATIVEKPRHCRRLVGAEVRLLAGGRGRVEAGADMDVI